eukprot:CAMPEP_0172314112 /NCGR_PEP_ID=MMETSP1058-20130122/21705_1 /TAXON_ID=83371 /ORGANISM="Detonula confervacea, Strain CCMP 353" /LENGTH=598 /DNA_ID=CAMNT_0013027893 /DNA_START=210 /DNA_END=2009 /DNA_ORIENTATION=+
MSSISSVAAKRVAQLAKGRSLFASRAQYSSAAFASTTSLSWNQRTLEPAPTASTLPLLSLYPTISSSALHMVNPSSKIGNRRAGTATPPTRKSSDPAIISDAQKKKNESNTNKQQSKKKKKKGQQANTGRLRLLQPLQPSNEILSQASRLTYHAIKEDTKIANVRLRKRKQGAQTIDLLSQKLCRPLKETVQTYNRELKYMHPFEKVVMELTVRARQKKDGLTLSTLLEDIHEGRKELLQLSKDWISKIKTAPTAKEAWDATEEGKEVMGKVFVDLIEEPWGGLMELQKSLRNVPIVRLDCPAVVLVGAPNVGKSSIVRAISSGTPEVNNYPFTTRGMTLGHVQVFWESDQDVAAGNVAGVSVPTKQRLSQESLLRRGVKSKRMKEKEAVEEFTRNNDIVGKKEDDGADIAAESGGDNEGTPSQVVSDTPKPIAPKRTFPISQLCQIMDSPGVIVRSEGAQRNEMEELTLAAMAHLPTAVMYVMDLSGGAGDKCSSVEDQLILRRDMRARFPRRPWIDVIAKVDLGIVDGAQERLAQILEAEQKERGGDAAGQFFIELSVKDGQGVDELRQEVMRMLGEVRVVLDAMAAMDERSARAV